MAILSRLILLVALSLSLSSCDKMMSELGIFGPKDKVPLGEYAGYWTSIEEPNEDDAEKNLAKITLYELERNDVVGVGIFNFMNHTHRMNWQFKGNTKDNWNLQFLKESNVYSDITQTFGFDGNLTVTETARNLNGTLRYMVEGGETKYLIRTSQNIDPELIADKAAPSAKAGESIDIECLHCGKEPAKVIVKLVSKTAQNVTEIPVSRLEMTEEGTRKITIPFAENLEKGDYSIYLIRDGKYESNSIPAQVL